MKIEKRKNPYHRGVVPMVQYFLVIPGLYYGKFLFQEWESSEKEYYRRTTIGSWLRI